MRQDIDPWIFGLKIILRIRLREGGEFYLDFQMLVLYIRHQFFRTYVIMKISLVGLAPGVHQFHFDENPAVWGLENHPNLRDKIQLDVQLEKSPTHLYVRSQVHARGHFECDRCLSEFEMMLEDAGRVLFSNDAELVQEGDNEVRTFDPEAREIDITEEVRDLLLLAIPVKLLCRENCKGLCAGCGANLNHESCRCTPRAVDPRWQVLQHLLDNSK